MNKYKVFSGDIILDFYLLVILILIGSTGFMFVSSIYDNQTEEELEVISGKVIRKYEISHSMMVDVKQWPKNEKISNKNIVAIRLNDRIQEYANILIDHEYKFEIEANQFGSFDIIEYSENNDIFEH